MATRYNLQITFGGDESEAPDEWQADAIGGISNMINRGLTSGETVIWDFDRSFRVFWTLDAEDE